MIRNVIYLHDIEYSLLGLPFACVYCPVYYFHSSYRKGIIMDVGYLNDVVHY